MASHPPNHHRWLRWGACGKAMTPWRCSAVSGHSQHKIIEFGLALRFQQKSLFCSPKICQKYFKMASEIISSSLSSSSSTRPSWKFDVFLCFRGEDTRKGFTDHLYNALNRRGIRTFRDVEKLGSGEVIGPELLKTIEESRFAIIILSKDFASSPWCLEEVAKIAECKKMMGQTVLPIFYDVEASHVMKQTGPFGEAFAEHERVFKDDDIGKWRKALTEVTNVFGWDLKDR